MKSMLKLGSITFGLGLMLAPLGQAQNWSSESNLGGVPTSLPYPIPVPGTDILQIFYQGTDHALWTRYRNPDGNWSGESRLGGQLSSASSEGGLSAIPTAIQIPGTNTLQVFYRGADNALWTLWRNPDGSWSQLQSLAGILGGDPAVTVIPGTNTVQVFYQGANQQMYTRWLTNGTWSSEQGLGGSLFTQTCDDPTNPSCYGTPAIPVPIQLPGTNDLEVFYRGSNGHLQAFRRNQDTSWTPQDFGGSMASDPSAAPVPNSDVIEVFYQGNGGCQSNIDTFLNGNCQASGGGLMTQFGDLNSWTGETQMAGHLQGYWCSDVLTDAATCLSWAANYGVPRAYTQPSTNEMFVTYPGADGGVWASAPTLWGQTRTADGNWSSEYSLGTNSPGYGSGSSDVTYANVPGTTTVEIFYAGYVWDALNGSDYGVMTQWTQQ